MTTLNLTRQGTQSELTDLIRSRTELECTIADLQLAAQRAGGRRNALEEDLATVEYTITAKEQELAAIIPEWDRVRGEENTGRRHLDEARARLEALYAKRGRLDKFRTKGERDRYLRAEIASMQQFRTGQANALAGLEQELVRAQQSLAEVNSSINATQAKAEDARNQVRELGEKMAQLKDEQAEKTERRKELWREDAKLESLVTNAADELRGAERTLASMMDKVRSLVTSAGPPPNETDRRTQAMVFGPSTVSLHRAGTSTVSTVPCIACSKSPMISSTSPLSSRLVTGLPTCINVLCPRR